MPKNEESEWDQVRAGLTEIGASDINQLLHARLSYGESWAKRGGVGAFMNLGRKWDRLSQAAETCGWDIFQAVIDDPRCEGVIDDLRDLRHYLLLVEEYLTRHYPEDIQPQYVKEEETLAEDPCNDGGEITSLRDDDPVHPQAAESEEDDPTGFLEIKSDLESAGFHVVFENHQIIASKPELDEPEKDDSWADFGSELRKVLASMGKFRFNPEPTTQPPDTNKSESKANGEEEPHPFDHKNVFPLFASFDGVNLKFVIPEKYFNDLITGMVAMGLLTAKDLIDAMEMAPTRSDFSSRE